MLRAPLSASLVGTVFLVIAAPGCGPSPSTCVPGEQIACACGGGPSGVQRCASDGTYGACDCAGPDASTPDASTPVDASLTDAAAPTDAATPLDAGSDAGDAGPPRPDAGPDPVCMDQLDLLFMVDNSNSMSEEQTSLTAELPRLVRALASGDSDGDGTPDFAPIASLHVGVVTSDMGVGGFMVPTCNTGTFGALLGDDGVLLTRGRTSIPGCMATYPAVFSFMSGDSADAFASEVACVVTAGTGGCGFEQQLDAVLKALSPSVPQAWTVPGYVSPVFVDGTSGHADGANAGFVRAGSILATVIVTDEEDCSALDPRLFDPMSPMYSADLNLRCFTYPDATHPVSRFVDGLSALRRDPGRLVVSVIAGVPVGLSGDTAAEYDVILADPDMIERLDTSMPGLNRLAPSCNVPGRGLAFPPRRIVEVARGLDLAGAQTDVHSICQSSFAASIDALVRSVAQAAAACE
jgi:hypothetical protein